VPNRFSPITAYLDSNVLFSASYAAENDFLELWRMQHVTLATSPYVVHEVQRNLPSEAQHLHFETLLAKLIRVSDGPLQAIPAGIALVAKDQPVLASAIFASMDYLITGDRNHFGHLYGTTVAGVEVLSPAQFKIRYRYRITL
jgi:predicted nucleic acid-binding protein